MIRDLYFAAIFEIINSMAQDVFGDGYCLVLIKLHVRSAFNFSFMRCCDDLRVEVFGYSNYRLHNALHIDNHGFDRAGENG